MREGRISMEFRHFGPTPAEVPVIGQGTWYIDSADTGAAITALRLGLDLGMSHIDTAEMYGSAEEIVGEAIAGRRDQVFLASKVLPSNASFKGTLKACARSLKRLRTDRLDLYMLHWPGHYPIRETMRAMEQLIDDGVIRFIGVSNFDVEDLVAATSALRNQPMASNQVLYHLGDRGIERRVLPYCAQHGIAVVAYSPFGHGSFPSPRSASGRLLAAIAERHGRTPRQVALNFLTRHPSIFTIPKASRAEHVRENSGGTGWNLTREEIAAIDRAFPAPEHDTALGVL
jgi:diketogulonate reductase-like aldo/keto reductase